MFEFTATSIAGEEVICDGCKELDYCNYYLDEDGFLVGFCPNCY